MLASRNRRSKRSRSCRARRQDIQYREDVRRETGSGVLEAVRWHCPFYGVEGQGWLLAFAAFRHHVKFSFFKGASLKPVPPIGQYKDVRSLDVHESDELDEKQLATRIKQAASIPGWDGGGMRRGGTQLQGRSPIRPQRPGRCGSK